MKLLMVCSRFSQNNQAIIFVLHNFVLQSQIQMINFHNFNV